MSPADFYHCSFAQYSVITMEIYIRILLCIRVSRNDLTHFTNRERSQLQEFFCELLCTNAARIYIKCFVPEKRNSASL